MQRGSHRIRGAFRSGWAGSLAVVTAANDALLIAIAFLNESHLFFIS